MTDDISGRTSMDYFVDLGERVERRWRAAGFDTVVFAAIAAEELQRTPAHRCVSLDDVIEWCNRPGFDLPRQHDINATFGDPPITVYRGHDMHIDVNVWMSSTTTIHEHGFQGAFQVLLGSSTHTEYTFEEQRRYNHQAFAGILSATACEVLTEGHTRAIVSGPDFIHSLFHLDEPAATVVIRTAPPNPRPQRDFFVPGLAFDSFNLDPTAKRLEQFAVFMCQTRNPRIQAWLSRYLEAAGPREAYNMLRAVTRAWTARGDVGDARLDELLAPHLEQVEGTSWWGEFVGRAFRRTRRMSSLVAARRSIASPELRFFLALLLNAPSPSALLRLIAQRYPERDPLDTAFSWVAALCVPNSPVGLTVNRTMQRMARLIAEGRTLEEIGFALDATRRTMTNPTELAAAEAALRSTFLDALFPRVTGRRDENNGDA